MNLVTIILILVLSSRARILCDHDPRKKQTVLVPFTFSVPIACCHCSNHCCCCCNPIPGQYNTVILALSVSKTRQKIALQLFFSVVGRSARYTLWVTNGTRTQHSSTVPVPLSRSPVFHIMLDNQPVTQQFPRRFLISSPSLYLYLDLCYCRP